MRHKISWKVKAGKLNAVIVSLDCPEHTICDPLGSFSGMISRKHPIDIGIVRCPEAFSDVHGTVVDRRDYQNLIIVHNGALLLQFL